MSGSNTLELPRDAAAALAEPGTRRADPLADDTITRILGRWDGCINPTGQWATIDLVNRELATWQNNGMLAGWSAAPDVPPDVAAALEDYVRSALHLPDWAEPAQIARAETLFFDISMMSCTLLFCASLPECYVLPDLAGVLHAAGQLEKHTDYRVRATAAMIFPVMMKNGLTGTDGGGVAQILKVRLIHATIRHLLLRGDPRQTLLSGAAYIEALPTAGRSMQQTLYARGWDIAQYGLPCNQQELAYTLLTFSYVYLRGLRKLGIGLSRADEEAYLHAWNVTGHVLGIERTLMADTMEQAEKMFLQMQADGRAISFLPDPRPDLGQALMRAMENEIPFRLLKSFPVLLTRHLCGKSATQDLALNDRVSLISRAVFIVTLLTARAIDATVRLLLPEFSLCRLAARVLGYQFTVKLLMDQTRPLKLPTALLHELNSVVATWHEDPKAPKWVNTLEARMTGRQQRTGRDHTGPGDAGP
ncbi:oxygenase MpaB family protein [Stigmatella sp. ncwal1]|uniref:Oxygenase MpaB family protein n=1 Tax=Stigmatella ashevillensis TaxID=2995309 RepID=A0ABT5DDY3_9BACT|nr:oxygenase MpaB family protein [Stigmatella ashevillena]MDC0711862.1 oxygenase MpaB family protein [Stigmatella ashevillena]